jgi:hypothetical protein
VVRAFVHTSGLYTGPLTFVEVRTVHWPFLKRRFRPARRYSDVGIEDDEQVAILLGPSDQVTRVLDMQYVTGWLTPGERAWVYVTTSLGREVFGKRPASLYIWSGNGWAPPP